MLSKWLYNLAITLYGVAIRVVSPFSHKAKLWLSGRKDWESRLSHFVLHQIDKPIVWVHAASLGEFEQGRPVIESLKAERQDLVILLTFFSPSGYEIRKNYEKADCVAYIPLDTQSNAKRFIEIVKPRMALFIKYEFWFNHLLALERAQVPTILVSGRLHERQSFFRPWGSWMQYRLRQFDYLFLQDVESASLLHSIGVSNHMVNGDTRFDRVFSIREQADEIPAIVEFKRGRSIIVIGSSWSQEERMLANYLAEANREDICLAIAPHEIREERLREIETLFENTCIRLSQWRSGSKSDVMIIDSIGQLAGLYRYAEIAFVGGGYGSGIHNTLEPAVWSVPVLFGPRYERFPEAVGLVKAYGAQPIHDQLELNKVLDELLDNDEYRGRMAHAAASYCEQHRGATAPIVSHVLKRITEKS